MQKRIKMIILAILLIIFIIIGILKYNTNDEYFFKYNGIVYALSLDGTNVTSFPNKGLYKVDVSCNGADGKWLYDDWKLEVENIVSDVSCNIKFNTISKIYFNDYLTKLSGSTQGNGKVIKEIANTFDYSTAVPVSKDLYVSKNIISTDKLTDTNGIDADNVYTFVDDAWTSVSSAMTSKKYYHFKFNPRDSGYYQICYNLSAGNTNNALKVFVNTTGFWFKYSNGTSNSLPASLSEDRKGCIELGYVDNSDYIEVVQRAYTNISTLKFNIKKATVTNSFDAGIRFEGKNPNNYVWFNNEYWRIIGVFDSASHGQSGKNLVKIIRDDTLDGFAWNKSNSNDWTTSSLNKILNEAYYNAQDGTNADYCFGGLYVKSNCDYTKTGIQLKYKNMISNVTWYLGGYKNDNLGPRTSEIFYALERGTIVYSGNPTTAIGYIGLMYPSDYGYSVLSSDCARNIDLFSYDNISCAGQSWLYGNGSESVLMHNSSNHNEIIYLDDFGNINRGVKVVYGKVSRPVLYLDSSVFVYDGDGSLENPYIIGM